MKFLIAGYGSIGRRHLRNLRALGQHDLLLLRSHASTLPDDEIRDIPVETTIEAALSHKPDGVVIANPTALHLKVAIPAARAGCAILMEKPISDHTDELKVLAELVSADSQKFQMGFQYRFHPGLLKVRERLANGCIGRPLSFYANWGEYLPDWHPWEDYRKSYSACSGLGGGVALTLCHPLDTLRWLFGDAAEIWGFSGKISDLELDVDDIAEIGLRLHNDMTGTVHLDYYRRFMRNDLEIVGTEGVLHWRNADARVVYQSINQSEAETWLPDPPFDRNQLFIDEMRHFIALTAGEAQSPCTLQDGLISERMVRALKQSSSEKRVIALDSFG